MNKMATTLGVLAEWPQDIVVTTKMVKSVWLPWLECHHDLHRKNGDNKMATTVRTPEWPQENVKFNGDNKWQLEQLWECWKGHRKLQ
ncbi:MAG: hypothetical protein P4L87_10795 [Formivibrio sp.]|nr:hypothetical protein [Formivibrio sp.]